MECFITTRSPGSSGFQTRYLEFHLFACAHVNIYLGMGRGYVHTNELEIAADDLKLESF